MRITFQIGREEEGGGKGERETEGKRKRRNEGRYRGKERKKE